MLQYGIQFEDKEMEKDYFNLKLKQINKFLMVKLMIFELNIRDSWCSLLELRLPF
jgi:hypothetical protein